MKFSHPAADVFVPDSTVSADQALARTTHLCVAAHQDDIEIMAYHGIAECFGRADKWFSGVVVTNGAGSPRSGVYESFTDTEMQAVRRREQRKAAYVGDYSIQLQLAHPSGAAKNPRDAMVQADLAQIFSATRAEVVYLHQPADKHDTHLAVLAHALTALRALPVGERPRRVLGCEVWRDLDWLCDADKQVLDVSAFPNVAASLVGVFDSQITGGKR
jgi:LmbE family N-acetylglucosaminyl deacetylase